MRVCWLKRWPPSKAWPSISDGRNEHRHLPLAGREGRGRACTRLKARGVLTGAFGPDAIRVVTHRDVSRKDCIDAAEALTEEIETQIATTGLG